jgi:hypothetical protein
VTLVVFLLLLPAVIVVTATWAWRYQLRVLSLLQRADHRFDTYPKVRLAGVAITDHDRVALEVEHPGASGLEQFAVALDVPSVALSTLQAWHDGRAPLILIVPAGRNIVRFRCEDPPETLTLRRVAS